LLLFYVRSYTDFKFFSCSNGFTGLASLYRKFLLNGVLRTVARHLLLTTCGLTLAGGSHRKGSDESKRWCYLPAVSREHAPAGAKPPVSGSAFIYSLFLFAKL